MKKSLKTSDDLNMWRKRLYENISIDNAQTRFNFFFDKVTNNGELNSIISSLIEQYSFKQENIKCWAECPESIGSSNYIKYKNEDEFIAACYNALASFRKEGNLLLWGGEVNKKYKLIKIITEIIEPFINYLVDRLNVDSIESKNKNLKLSDDLNMWRKRLYEGVNIDNAQTRFNFFFDKVITTTETNSIISSLNKKYSFEQENIKKWADCPQLISSNNIKFNDEDEYIAACFNALASIRNEDNFLSWGGRINKEARLGVVFNDLINPFVDFLVDRLNGIS